MRQVGQVAKNKPREIRHIDELDPSGFVRFLEKFSVLSGQLEASEKLDGSARITFGPYLGGIWTQSKNGPRRFCSKDYGDRPMYRALREAHKVLELCYPHLTMRWPIDLESLTAEVMWGKMPNSIEYGRDGIVIHGFSGSISERDVCSFVDLLHRQGRAMHSWFLGYKSEFELHELHVKLIGELVRARMLERKISRLHPDRLKRAVKPEYRSLCDSMTVVQRSAKKKMLSKMYSLGSKYGLPGGDIEGIVFKDLEDGSLVKLVDKDRFTALNKFYWRYRELLDKGCHQDGKWRVGIRQHLLDLWAHHVISLPLAKTPGFVKHIQGLRETPDEVSSDVIFRFCSHDNIFPEMWKERALENIMTTRDMLLRLKHEWSDHVFSDPHVILPRNGSQEVVRMPQTIIERTNAAFNDMTEELEKKQEKLESISETRHEIMARVSFMEIFLGERTEKI